MDNDQNKSVDLDAIRARLEGAHGQAYWRSLEEVADTEEFQRWIDDEFPARATLKDIDRRKFLHLMGASLALAGLTGCRNLPGEKLVPHVKQPEEQVLGNPLAFATSMSMGTDAIGLIVESREGRPTKIEGNPNHPASLGTTDVWAQASLLSLYDPDRAQVVKNQGEINTWDGFTQTLRTALAQQRGVQGAGLRVLTETVTSPTLAAQMEAFLARYPQARWHQYEPGNRDNVRAGARQAFGNDANAVYRFDRARVIVSLDADFLLTMPGHVRYSRDFISGRRVRQDRTGMNRLYVAESTPTITGTMADHRLPLRASEIEAFARALASALGVPGVTGSAAAPASVPANFLGALARDLQASRGASLVVAGDQQPPAVHALVHAINQALGNANRTVVYTAPIEARPDDQNRSLRELVEAMNAGRVQALLILGGNPAYNAPADLKFAEALQARDGDRDRVPLRARLGMYEDETSALCQWHLPETHFLEAWSDTRAFDGTAAIVQPLIAPLYDNRSTHETVAYLLEQPRPGYEIVRGYWQNQRPAAGFEVFWEKTLNDGLVRGSAFPARVLAMRPNFDVPSSAAATAANGGLEIIFPLDPTIWDGRYSNNGWLQELPKPLTKLTWDNAAILSPLTARRLDLRSEDVVELRYGGRTVVAPVWIEPGHPDESVSVHLGYGRTVAGKVGTASREHGGFNANLIRTADAPSFGQGLEIRKTGDRYALATTQQHHAMDTGRNGSGDMLGRDIIRVSTITNFVQKGGRVGPGDAGPDTPGEGRNREATLPGGPASAPEEPAPGAAAHPEHESGETVPADPYQKLWEYKKDSHEAGEAHPSIYPEYSYADYPAWSMVIDQNACIGCNACVVACQAENNIPTVGKDQVLKGREMHWIRIDRYHKGSLENPETYFQPLPCMHCEKAPCEPVCPVAATIHSHEGLNMQVYNRCIGTRYCSNNCPYKVRRFNFLKWTAGAGGPTTNNYELPVLKMVNNPEVTVRGRGVMEKCTYCVQRISRVRIQAKQEERAIKDGEVVTACAQVCPTEAIFFGDANDKNSRLYQTKTQPHNYGLLEELNTQPRTTYLARLRNPNPQIEPPASEEDSDGH